MMLFIHSGYFYNASSGPLLLRSAPDTAWILHQSFMPMCHRQLRVKDLPKVPTWQLERDSNPRPFGRNLRIYQWATIPTRSKVTITLYFAFSFSPNSNTLQNDISECCLLIICTLFSWNWNILDISRLFVVNDIPRWVAFTTTKSATRVVGLQCKRIIISAIKWTTQTEFCLSPADKNYWNHATTSSLAEHEISKAMKESYTAGTSIFERTR